MVILFRNCCGRCWSGWGGWFLLIFFVVLIVLSRLRVVVSR